MSPVNVHPGETSSQVSVFVPSSAGALSATDADIADRDRVQPETVSGGCHSNLTLLSAVAPVASWYEYDHDNPKLHGQV